MRPACPGCGGRGRAVPDVTPRSLLTGRALERLPDRPLAFCADPKCGVVYFGGGTSFLRADLRVPVFLKERGGDRLLCYCLELTENDLASESTRDANLERIQDLLEARRCACELRNPEGSCCYQRARAAAGKGPVGRDGTCDSVPTPTAES